MPTKYLTRADVPEFLERERGVKTSKATLAKLASIGGGPLFRRFGGRVVYTEEDVLAWADNRISEPLTHSGAAASK